MSSPGKKKIVIITGVIAIPILLLNLLIINWFVYPFTSANPNFSDVEATFNKLQIPADWTVIEESENRGLAGRQCPIESETVCFSKEAVFKLPEKIDASRVGEVIKTSGCISPYIEDMREYKKGAFSTDISCTNGPIIISGTFREVDGEKTASIRTRTQ